MPAVGMCVVLGSGRLCVVSGRWRTLCVTFCPTGLPLDTTSVNTTVCCEQATALVLRKSMISFGLGDNNTILQYPGILKNSDAFPFISYMKNSAAQCVHVYNKRNKSESTACVFEDQNFCK